ncbi:uncharacterized protein APUU_10212S [Aspergillus puulaauensis]|uniref:Nitroreductase domain-containing protein n=1 Tax=Aspergillus puulaauensis TaxID=1220207 RepID=A0A7R7XB13_9EURO|nr:uncharacterized protein APUU_10212S [Aspergillus puulaauensis]BCS17384.1 hypothetical protein APUU_10212S [Aspergillus puulaauensis]
MDHRVGQRDGLISKFTDIVLLAYKYAQVTLTCSSTNSNDSFLNCYISSRYLPAMSATKLNTLASQRYRDTESSTFADPTASSSSPIPEALQTILSHKSCRAFLPAALANGTLETLLTAGSSGSTSSLYQTWSVVAIQEPEHKAKVAALADDQEFIRQAPLLLVFCPNLRRLHTLSTHYGQQPARALDSMDMFIISVVDAAIAGQNVAIAAEAMGLGICYVGAIRNNAAELCELLNLPPLTWGGVWHGGWVSGFAG